MREIAELYQKQAVRSSCAWLATLQEKAAQDLTRLQFPTRKDEDWKYTSFDAFYKDEFKPASGIMVQEPSVNLASANPIWIKNGLLELDDNHPLLALGIIIAPLMEAITTHESLVKPYLGQILKHEHGFQAFNTMAFTSGLFIYVPKGVTCAEPVLINHYQDETNSLVQHRHLIILEEAASITIIHHFLGNHDTTFFTNTNTEIALAPFAELTHYTIQEPCPESFCLNHITTMQASNSQYYNHSLNFGGKLARADLSINLNEPHAQCLLNGIYVPTNKQHIDHHTTIYHHVPDCISHQDYKGILSDSARGVFNGKIVVAKDAVHTEAKQQNKNILLSPRAEINTKPQLEIFADDVTCTHGATVGQLDEDALFYMMARGINRDEASHFLIHAFAETNLRSIPHSSMSTWIDSLINEQLGV